MDARQSELMIAERLRTLADALEAGEATMLGDSRLRIEPLSLHEHLTLVVRHKSKLPPIIVAEKK